MPKPQTMDNAKSTLKIKLKQLERAEEKADQALKGKKQSAIQRQLTNLKELVTEVDSACDYRKNRRSGWSYRKP